MVAKVLAHNGAKAVYIIGRRESKLQEASKFHANIIPLVGDITSQDSLKSMASTIEKETGYINLLVANAGIMGPKLRDLAPDCSLSDFVNHAWSTPVSEFTQTYEVNVSGVYYTCLAFLELLAQGNEEGNKLEGTTSQIITISSIASFSRLRGASFAYSSSKAAVTHLSKHLSTYLGRFRIRVNAIAPGIYPSELSTPLSHVQDGTKDGAVETTMIPEGRTGKLEDMAGIVLFLAGKAGAYNNGCVLVNDGGRLSVLPSTY